MTPDAFKAHWQAEELGVVARHLCFHIAVFDIDKVSEYVTEARRLIDSIDEFAKAPQVKGERGVEAIITTKEAKELHNGTTNNA